MLPYCYKAKKRNSKLIIRVFREPSDGARRQRKKAELAAEQSVRTPFRQVGAERALPVTGEGYVCSLLKVCGVKKPQIRVVPRGLRLLEESQTVFLFGSVTTFPSGEGAVPQWTDG